MLNRRALYAKCPYYLRVCFIICKAALRLCERDLGDRASIARRHVADRRDGADFVAVPRAGVHELCGDLG